jgi:NADPH:quinone reductase-like Zn-dependent oxidoreductase
MKVIQVNNPDQGPVLILAELEKPEPGLGEILIQVHAAGVTPTELLWYTTTHTKSGTARLRAVPGHEFSGVITAIGKDVQDFEIGDEVYGMNDWFADGGDRGVLYYAAPIYCAEAHNLKSRSCRLSADRSLDFMARTDRSREARAR